MQLALLDDNFLPEGGYLRFGLCHECPIANGPYRNDVNRSAVMSLCLKGHDVLVRRVCAALGLQTSDRLHLSSDYPESGVSTNRSDGFKGAYVEYEMLREYVHERHGVDMINIKLHRPNIEYIREINGKTIGEPDFDVLNDINNLEVGYTCTHYGNESEAAFAYGAF